MNAPRAYCEIQDLSAMLVVLMRGRKVDNGSYYIHIGDLMWWLYYPPLEGEFWDYIYLWDDPESPGRLLGWALISPELVGVDVYLQPELLGSPSAREMYLWAEEQAVSIAYGHHRKTISMAWVRHDDAVLTGHLTQRGFRLGRGMMQFQHRLDEPLPRVKLADGFILRGCMGEPEVAARAKAQYGAFGSFAPFERYLQRFTNFMRSPVYQPVQDIVAVAPDGQIGAFCIVWTDPVNKVGLFEPVGTHPDFQRKGLGRAVMLEGLTRLQNEGMQTAIVATGEDHLMAIKFYEAVGFQAVQKLGTYEKEV